MRPKSLRLGMCLAALPRALAIRAGGLGPRQYLQFRDIQRAARRERLTTAEWVRQALRVARRSVPGTAAKKKLAVVRSATQHAFPTGDVGQMLREIERGYLDEEP